VCEAEIPLPHGSYITSNSHFLLHQISLSTLVLMGLSLTPRLSGERSSGAMHDWLEGLVGFEPLLDEEAKCCCL
jgi:hypothetical protein